MIGFASISAKAWSQREILQHIESIRLWNLQTVFGKQRQIDSTHSTDGKETKALDHSLFGHPEENSSL
jgi:hypothetical protein